MQTGFASYMAELVYDLSSIGFVRRVEFLEVSAVKPCNIR